MGLHSQTAPVVGFQALWEARENIPEGMRPLNLISACKWAVLSDETISVSLGISESCLGNGSPTRSCPELSATSTEVGHMPAFLSDPSQPVQRGAGLASLVPGDLPGQHVFRAAQPQSQQGGLTQTRRVCFLKKKNQA